MEIIEVDAAGSQPVDHPLGVLQRHGPAYAVKALIHGKLMAQLSLHGADGLGIAPVSYTHLDVYKRQRRNRAAG